MRALTHNLFSLGIGVYLVVRAEQQLSVLDLLLVVWLALATNWVIDALGHTVRQGRSVRSFRTHSVFLGPIWGIATAVGSAFLLSAIMGQKMTLLETSSFAGLGVVLAFSHLFLDSLTEGGVFFGRRRRVALAHLGNNNVIANTAFSALGLLLVVGAFA